MSINMKNILIETINTMETVENLEDGKLSGLEKKMIAMKMIEDEIGLLYQSYKDEIETIIECVIFLSKLKKKIKVNKISKSCFSFI